MNEELDQFLKRKLSLEELGLSEPDHALIGEARRKVMARKQQRTGRSFFEKTAEAIAALLHSYRPALALMAAAGCLIYFAGMERGATGASYMSESVSTYSSTSSSTLASLTQPTGTETPVNSSTVLASIVTIVVR